jgi:sulfur carrier protein
VTIVTLNGKPMRLPDPPTVRTAVREAGAMEGGRGVAVAVDGEVVPHGEWERLELREGQQVEVLQAVQGG